MPQTLVSSPERTLGLISKGSYLPDASKAWDEGSNIKACLRLDPKATKAAICAIILDVVTFIDAKKSLERSEDVVFTAEAIIEEFPTLKLEELKLVGKRMKLGYYGTYYERLKTPEFFEALKKHEGERAEYLETKHKKTISEQAVETAAIASTAFNLRSIADDLRLPRKGALTLRDFMRQGPLLTPQEISEIEDAKTDQNRIKE